MCEVIAPLASRVALCAVPSARSRPPEELAALFQRVRPRLRTEVLDIPAALRALAKEPVVVVTGSLSFLGSVYFELHRRHGASRFETRLNEYRTQSKAVPQARDRTPKTVAPTLAKRLGVRQSSAAFRQ
jgi:hypothetical protein